MKCLCLGIDNSVNETTSNDTNGNWSLTNVTRFVSPVVEFWE